MTARSLSWLNASMSPKGLYIKKNPKLTVSASSSVWQKRKVHKRSSFPHGTHLKVMCKTSITPSSGRFNLNLKSTHLWNIRDRKKNRLEGTKTRESLKKRLNGKYGGDAICWPRIWIPSFLFPRWMALNRLNPCVLFYFICVSGVCVCVNGVCMCSLCRCVHIWRPENKPGWFLTKPVYLILRRGLSLPWNSTSRLGRLTSES